MRVFLVRHGKAEPVEEWRGQDRDRPLRPRGERQARWLGGTLAARPIADRPGLILSSPYRRALETARIIQAALGCPLREERTLEPGHAARDLVALLRAHAGGAGPALPIMMVGHNPVLEEALALLVRGIRADGGVMHTGEGAELDYAPGGPSRLLTRLRMDDD